MPGATGRASGAWRRRAALLLGAVVAVVAQSEAIADAARGAELYTERCGGCHSIAENGPGPRHAGLFGRRAGTQPGFDYSKALKASRIVWDAEQLERWLANPNALVPGNKMVVQLASDPRDRADIIDYLREATRVEAKSADAAR